MRLIIALFFCSGLPLLSAGHLAPLQHRDADFESVRTHLLQSNSDKDADAPDKYFHESTFGGHYDGRFAAKRLDHLEKGPHLTALIQTYLSFMRDIGAETWLMHGTLLGWWWNRRVMPWDSDLDVMTSEKSIEFLADFYNMTVHKFRFADHELPLRSYLLEINPHCRNGSMDTNNKIDARWIDRDTGLFIDITTVRWNSTAAALSDSEALMVKDGHHYHYDEIWPLRETTFEGAPVHVPFAYPDILVEEYGEAALSMSRFQNHHFNEHQQQWLTKFEDPSETPPTPPTLWQRLTGFD